MSSPTSGPIPYLVSYSDLVRTELAALLARARAVGRERDVYDAVRAIDHVLRIYPQYGEPLRDLVRVPSRLMIATIPPLCVRYVLDEERRLVFVVVALRLMPHSGI